VQAKSVTILAFTTATEDAGGSADSCNMGRSLAPSICQVITANILVIRVGFWLMLKRHFQH